MELKNTLSKKVKKFTCRAYQIVRVLFYQFISDCQIEGKLKRNQPVLAVGLGAITVEGSVVIGFFPSPSFFSTYAHVEARGKNASIVINDGTLISNNFCAIAEHTFITIGRNCLIGASVEVLDSDFHGLHVSERNISRPEWAKPVQIGDSVFIGSNSKINKGVTIGAGAVVANGSVIVKDVPEYSVVGGNPAKVIKRLERKA